MATQITTAYRFHNLERETIVLNQPTLNPPSISIFGEKMSISDGNNGSFTKGFKIYVNDAYFKSTSDSFINFEKVTFPDNFLDGIISVSSYGDFFNDSSLSNEVLLRKNGYTTSESTLILTADYILEEDKRFKNAYKATLI